MGDELGVGNVSFGTNESDYSVEPGVTYERDTSQNVTFTFAYYYTLPPSGDISNKSLMAVIDNLEQSYADVKREWVGSLVTGEGDVSLNDINANPPPIQLPKLSEEDYLTFNQKVTQFPKNISDVSVFPDS